MRAALALLLLGGVAAAGCGSRARLSDARASADDLARAVLEAFQRRDERALRALAISELEFHHHIWPGLPAARPERNLPFSYVWGELRQKSEQHLAALLARHGGRRFDLLRVEHAGRTTWHGTYAVRRETVLVVRAESGDVQPLRLFGSTLEHAGAFKVFSFVVDD